jgi:hypothetical protein
MAKKKDLKGVAALATRTGGKSGDSPRLVEVTTTIREDQALALELIENDNKWHRGNPVSKDELFQEALDLLIAARLIPIRVGVKAQAGELVDRRLIDSGDRDDSTNAQ